MAYNLHDLRVEGVAFSEVLGCQISGGIGAHGTLKIFGYTESEEVLHDLPNYQEIEIYAGGPGEKQILFSGVISDITFQCSAGTKILVVEGKSSSYLMDITKHSRSFQDIEMSYMTMMGLVMDVYPESTLYYAAPEAAIGHLFVQYEETDWQFLKRVMSMLGLTITPDCRQKGIKLYAGLLALPEQDLSYQLLNIEKDMHSFYTLQANGYQVEAADFTRYQISSEYMAGIFEEVKVGEYPLVVYNYQYDFTKQEMLAQYALQRPQGLLNLPVFPLHMIGLALNGTVCGVSGSNVQVMLDIDAEWGYPAIYWFPYSTISASSDGSGWYCMPEKGDTVRIYFPSKYEGEAVALSSVSSYSVPGGGQADRMADPNYRYLCTREGQMLALVPGLMTLTCGDGMSSVTIRDDGKISVCAVEKIEVNGTESVTIHADEKMVFQASEYFELKSNEGGTVALGNGNIGFYGTEVKFE